MKARRLDFLFNPSSLAVVGAGAELPDSVVAGLLANLRASYRGPIATVGVNDAVGDGTAAFASPAELPSPPELAIVLAQPAAVLNVLAKLGERGTKAAVVLDLGDEPRDDPPAAAIREFAGSSRMRLLGPGSLGLIAPGAGLNASLLPISPPHGRIALLAQSNAVMSVILARAATQGVGFSLAAALGDAFDIGFAEGLDHLALEPEARVVLLHIEEITEPRRFLSAARAVARLKPVVILKTGSRRQPSADEDDAGSFARIDREQVFDAAIRRAGLLRVSTLGELLAAGRMLESRIEVDGDRIAVVGNGSGIVELGENSVRHIGAQAASPSMATWDALADVLHRDGVSCHELRLPDHAGSAAYASALGALQRDEAVDAVIVIHAPSLSVDGAEIAQVIAKTVAKGRKPVFLVLPASLAAQAASQLRGSPRLAVYNEIHRAVDAFRNLYRHRRSQALLTATPAAVAERDDRDLDAARRLIRPALTSAGALLTQPQSLALLRNFGMPTVDARLVGSADAAMQAAITVGLPVDLSLESEPMRPVRGLAQAVDVRNAAAQLLSDAAATQSGAATPRLLLKQSPSADGPAATLRLVMACDTNFGPALAVMAGSDPLAVALPPLTRSLAQNAIAASSLPDLLRPLGTDSTAATEGLALCLAQLAQIAADLNEVRSINIDTLRLDASGVLAMSAQAHIAPAHGRPDRRLAFPPYPSFLVRHRALRNGSDVLIRPIRQEDEHLVRSFFAELSPADLRLRFFTHVKEVDHRVIVRMTNIDYDSEMSLVAIDPVTGEMLGLVGVSADVMRTGAEFAVSVRSDLKGTGLGRVLMLEIIDYAMQNGFESVWGEVLSENEPMLGLLRRLGFSIRTDFDDPGVMKVMRPLIV